MCECGTIQAIGQVPGQRYASRVVDQDGNGLYAGWFFLDSEGKQIMNDVDTDVEGYFHFTVPEHNHENIFVQFYADEKYDPVVKSFDELVNGGDVVLVKKSGQRTTFFVIGALALAAVALQSKQKRVGAINRETITREIKKPWHENKLVWIGAAGLAAWYIFKYKPTEQQKDFLRTARERLEYLAKEMGIVPSLPGSTFETMALQIIRAVDKCGTDMNAITRAFDQLNNEADFWLLAQTFGIAKYDGCFEGNLPSWNVHYTLPEALASDLSGSQMHTINRILNDKGIDVQL